MRIKLNTSKSTPIVINPTVTELDLGTIEETQDGKFINVTVIQTEFTQYGYRQQVEHKQYPKALESIITGVNLETGEPTVNIQALQSVFTPHGITII